jgi:hypothetical protein
VPYLERFELENVPKCKTQPQFKNNKNKYSTPISTFDGGSK